MKLFNVLEGLYKSKLKISFPKLKPLLNKNPNNSGNLFVKSIKNPHIPGFMSYRVSVIEGPKNFVSTFSHFLRVCMWSLVPLKS